MTRLQGTTNWFLLPGHTKKVLWWVWSGARQRKERTFDAINSNFKLELEQKLDGQKPVVQNNTFWIMVETSMISREVGECWILVED
jgi:hypothetical protein